MRISIASLLISPLALTAVANAQALAIAP